jgi:hypothetical protein
MNRKFIILALCCFIHFLSLGQHLDPCNCDSLLEKITEPSLIGDIFIKPLPSTVSPFFNDNWQSGEILLSNNVIVQKQRLKYNGFIDRLIWMNENFQMVKLDKASVDGFCLKDNVLPRLKDCFGKIKIKEEYVSDSVFVYAQILFRGDLSLYAYRKVVHFGTEEIKAYKIIVDAYEKRTFYYFKTGNHLTKGFLKINRRNLLDIFPGKREEIISYIHTGNHKIKTEEDLIGLAEWLNRK